MYVHAACLHNFCVQNKMNKKENLGVTTLRVYAKCPLKSICMWSCSKEAAPAWAIGPNKLINQPTNQPPSFDHTFVAYVMHSRGTATMCHEPLPCYWRGRRWRADWRQSSFIVRSVAAQSWLVRHHDNCRTFLTTNNCFTSNITEIPRFVEERWPTSAQNKDQANPRAARARKSYKLSSWKK